MNLKEKTLEQLNELIIREDAEPFLTDLNNLSDFVKKYGVNPILIKFKENGMYESYMYQFLVSESFLNHYTDSIVKNDIKYHQYYFEGDFYDFLNIDEVILVSTYYFEKLFKDCNYSIWNSFDHIKMNNAEKLTSKQILKKINIKKELTKNTQKEINEDTNKITRILNDKKTYHFVVATVEQENSAGGGTEYKLATLMSSEEIEERRIMKCRNPRNNQGFLDHTICATKSWDQEDIEDENIIFLNDETFKLLFDISL